jgi:TolB protein
MWTLQEALIVKLKQLAVWICFMVACGLPQEQTSSSYGIFEEHGDIGEVQYTGSVEYVAETGVYRVTGGGENMWSTQDACHFVWKRLSGDLSLSADVSFPEEGGAPHRKAGWMIRSSLEPDVPYADVAVHGDGTLSLQYRETTGDITFGIKAPESDPATVRLERTGDVIALYLVDASGKLQPIGSVSVPLPDSVYVGLFACAHDNNETVTAEFSNVKLQQTVVKKADKRVAESTLEIMDVETGCRKIVYRAAGIFEAPNWSSDGSELIINMDGRLHTIPVSGGVPKEIDTGFADRCNNDHGLSPDGRNLAISHLVQGIGSVIYVLPASGGVPRQITPLGPSYWHGWSPNGKTLAYCAKRQDNFDIYTIPEAGGEESRLTTAQGLDDGPDYSPDGEWIYFNSIRTGLMKIWRMHPDGTSQEQVTTDPGWADWFPHPSPDGQWIVFVSFAPEVKGHPRNKNVALRLMSVQGRGKPLELTRLFGGQGTLNVPSWSPDSRYFAFVSYRPIAKVD